MATTPATPIDPDGSHFAAAADPGGSATSAAAGRSATAADSGGSAADALLEKPPRFASRPPRFNHIAMSLPAELLDVAHRRQIVDFYHRVFGLREYEMMTEDRKQIVLGAYTAEQFVFLIADDAPMRCPRLDHFGLSVGSEDELDELLARCRAYQRQDDRVDIIDKRVEDHGVVKVKGFYVRYLLPLMVEVQYFDYGGTEGTEG